MAIEELLRGQRKAEKEKVKDLKRTKCNNVHYYSNMNILYVYSAINPIVLSFRYPQKVVRDVKNVGLHNSEFFRIEIRILIHPNLEVLNKIVE